MIFFILTDTPHDSLMFDTTPNTNHDTNYGGLMFDSTTPNTNHDTNYGLMTRHYLIKAVRVRFYKLILPAQYKISVTKQKK